MNRKQRGFTLIEMMVAMAVLLIIVGGVFQLLSQSQQRYVTTSTAQEATAMIRDALDQMIYEMRLAGNPPTGSYPAGIIIAGTNENFVSTGGGFLAAADYAVQFESDLDGDGQVEVIDYAIEVPTGWGGDACAGLTANADLTVPTLMRSVVAKNADGTAVVPDPQPFLDNIMNCRLNPPVAIFTYCPAPPTAGPAGCPDISTSPGTVLGFPGNTRIVLINLQVQTAVRDPQTGQFQQMEFLGMAQRVNPDR